LSNFRFGCERKERTFLDEDPTWLDERDRDLLDMCTRFYHLCYYMIWWFILLCHDSWHLNFGLSRLNFELFPIQILDYQAFEVFENLMFFVLCLFLLWKLKPFSIYMSFCLYAVQSNIIAFSWNGKSLIFSDEFFEYDMLQVLFNKLN